MGYDVTPEAQPRGEQRRCCDDARPVPVLVPQHPDVPWNNRCSTGSATSAAAAAASLSLSLRRGGRKLRRSVPDAVRVEVTYK